MIRNEDIIRMVESIFDKRTDILTIRHTFDDWDTIITVTNQKMGAAGNITLAGPTPNFNIDIDELIIELTKLGYEIVAVNTGPNEEKGWWREEYLHQLKEQAKL